MIRRQGRCSVGSLMGILAIAGVLLAGCSGNGTEGGAAEKSGGKTADIVMWHWMSDREDVFQELAKRYKEQTGIMVEIQLFAPSEAYSGKVRAAAQTKNLPDIFGVLAENRDFASFINAGHIENLTAYMDADNGEWKNRFYEKALSQDTFVPNNQFDVVPGIYGVPIDVMNIQFFYNKDMFKAAGLDPENPPQTFEEFIAAGKKLKASPAVGKAGGLVSGFGEIWMLNCLADNFAWNLMGEEKILKTLKGDVQYNDPDWIKVFSLFKEMGEADILAPGVITMVNKHAEQTFANQKAAMAFNGSWGVNVYRGMNPDLNYGIFLPPKVSDQYPVRVWGGAGSSFKVNAYAANESRTPDPAMAERKRKAVDFLRWLTEKDQQVLLAKETLNLPSNKNSAGDLPPILQQFAKTMDNAMHPNQLPVNEFPRVVETMGKGIQLIVIGEKTPEELAEEMTKVKSIEIERRNKNQQK